MTRTSATFSPPVMEARRWLDGQSFDNQPLINVSQAAPIDPPPANMRAAMAAMLDEADTHLYGPVLGLPALRRKIADTWTAAYGGEISPDHVAITSGCNQAFSAAISALCGEGDAVILPTPFYFNHKMWLDMQGVDAIPLPCGDGMIPDPEHAADLITPNTRAICLVTPNNPTGAEYPADVMQGFYDLCQSRGIHLIVDETYRDFHSSQAAPHGLFQQSGWEDVLVQLYSFSKAFRLTGHRVGAMVARPALLAEVEKFLDTVAICPTQLGQKAALWGMENLTDWLAGEREEVLNRRRAIEDEFHILAAKGWKLLGSGAYFAYVEHPFDMPSDQLAPQLVKKASVLCLPGTMFTPHGDADGQKQLRIAFANIDAAQIKQMFARLAELSA
ncbi:MAG: aminotransferase [Planktomarina sp.]